MKTANLIWNWYLDMLSSLAGMEKESIKDDDDDDDTPLKCQLHELETNSVSLQTSSRKALDLLCYLNFEYCMNLLNIEPSTQNGVSFFSVELFCEIDVVHKPLTVSNESKYYLYYSSVFWETHPLFRIIQ